MTEDPKGRQALLEIAGLQLGTGIKLEGMNKISDCYVGIIFAEIYS